MIIPKKCICLIALIVAGILLSAPGSAQASGRIQIKMIRVTDETGKAVPGDLDLLDPKGNESFFTSIPADFKPSPGSECSVTDRFHAHPASAVYEDTSPVQCAEVVAIVVRKQIFRQLVVAAKHADSNGRPEQAALIYNDAINRAPTDDASVRAQAAVYKSLGKAWNISDAVYVDPEQGNAPVPSEELQSRLASFQRENQLPETGLADYRTLHKLSGIDIYPSIARAYKASEKSP